MGISVYDFVSMYLTTDDVPLDIFDLTTGEVVASYAEACDAQYDDWSDYEIVSLDVYVRRPVNLATLCLNIETNF